MIITYLKVNEQIVSILAGFPSVWEKNNQLLIENGLSPLLNDLKVASWGYYQDTPIPPMVDDEGFDIVLYLKDLQLLPINAEDVPKSLDERVTILEGKVDTLTKP